MVIKRPILVVFLLLVFVIWMNRMVGNEESPPSLMKEAVQCVGLVEEIQVKSSGLVLVLSDIQMTCVADNSQVEVDKILVYDSLNIQLFSKVKIGQIVIVAGSYSAFQKATNPGEFNQYEYYISQSLAGNLYAEKLEIVENRCYYLQQGLFVLRRKAMEHLSGVMNEDDAGVLGAMILGDKSQLSETTKELYQKTGIGHILAISGLHISMLGAGVFNFLRRYVMSMKKAVIVTILFLFFYGQLTGFPVATTRAVIMMCCMLVARYYGRTYDAWSALALSGIVTLLQEPLQLFQSGFLLSYFTIAGILIFNPVIQILKVKNKLVYSLLGGSVFFFVTLPLMLYFYYEICPYTIVVNLIVLPILSLLLGIGIIGCIISFLCPIAGEFLLATAHYILMFYKIICQLVEKLPYGQIIVGRPSWQWIIIYYMVLLIMAICAMYFQKKQYIYVGVGILCCVICMVRKTPAFLYIQLDVGQGDCACIMYDDKTYLIDGGSTSEKQVGKYVIEDVLKFYGRNCVDGVFVTHSDEDHINGILELAKRQVQSGIAIKAVIMPQIQNKDDKYIELQKAFEQYNITVIPMEKGDVHREKDLVFSCLHPSSDYDWKSSNDYSLTLDISYRDLRMLTTGDLEESGEDVVKIPRDGYDVLKVGHHGSKTSTSESFLAKVNPQVALISCGKDNRYGHPAAEVVKRLENAGSKVYETTECGAILVDVEKGVYGYIGRN